MYQTERSGRNIKELVKKIYKEKGMEIPEETGII